MNIYTSKTGYLEVEIKRLHEANQAMLEALKAVMKYDGHEIPYEAFMGARAAIAKGEQQ